MDNHQIKPDHKMGMLKMLCLVTFRRPQESFLRGGRWRGFFNIFKAQSLKPQGAPVFDFHHNKSFAAAGDQVDLTHRGAVTLRQAAVPYK